jgi:hypothetical protein
MPDPARVIDEAGASAAPLSWRDVYKAVGDSESRVIAAINAAVFPLASAAADHETRIRVLEAYANALPTAERAILISRITGVEKQVATFLDREQGIFSTLGAGKTFIIVLAAVVSPLIALVSLIVNIGAK